MGDASKYEYDTKHISTLRHNTRKAKYAQEATRAALMREARDLA